MHSKPCASRPELLSSKDETLLPPGLEPESQGQNLAMTVSYVPCSLESGSLSGREGGARRGILPRRGRGSDPSLAVSLSLSLTPPNPLLSRGETSQIMQTGILSHSLSLSLSVCLSLSLTLTHTFSRSLSHTLPYSLTHTLSRSHTHTHTHTRSLHLADHADRDAVNVVQHARTHTHTHNLSLSLTHTLSLCHTDTHTHIQTPSLSLPSPSEWRSQLLERMRSEHIPGGNLKIALRIEKETYLFPD
jgi:hypothetical protein